MGVLLALEEIGVPVRAVVGCPIGAVVGGFYAADVSPQRWIDSALRFSRIRLPMLFRPDLSGYALLSDRGLRRLLSELRADTHLPDLATHFVAVASDLNTGMLGLSLFE